MVETNFIADGRVMPPRVSEWQRFRKAFFSRKIVILGLVLMGVFLLFAIFAGSIDGKTPWVAPYNPYQVELTNPLASPSWEHWLGTDTMGRDIFSRIIHGTKFSLTVSVLLGKKSAQDGYCKTGQGSNGNFIYKLDALDIIKI